MRLTLSASAVMLVLTAASLTVAGQTQDLSGAWTLTVKRTDNQIPARLTEATETFVIKQDGSKLTGKHVRGEDEYSVSGTVKGDRLTFAWKGMAGDKPVGGQYTGTVTSQSSISGTVAYSGGWTGEWKATREVTR